MPTRTVALAVTLDHVLSLCLAPHPLCQSTEHSSAFVSIPMAYPDHVPSPPTSQALSAVAQVSPPPSALQRPPPRTCCLFTCTLSRPYIRADPEETDSRNEAKQEMGERSQKDRVLFPSSPACNRCLNANSRLTLNT